MYIDPWLLQSFCRKRRFCPLASLRHRPKPLPNIREVDLFNNQHQEARGVLKDASDHGGRFINFDQPLVASEFLSKTAIMSFDKTLPNIREVNLFNNQHYEARGVLKDASYRDGRFLNVYRPLVV